MATSSFWPADMDWITPLLQAALRGDPLVILAVVVLAFVYLIWRLGLRVLTTIERIARPGAPR